MEIRSESEGIVPFKFNVTQNHFYGQRTRRDIILKPRRLGFSSYILAEYLWEVVTHEGVTGFIMAHDPKATQYLFGCLKIMFDSIPEMFRPKVGLDNANELTFPETKSKISVASAGSTEQVAKKVGRSEQVNYLLLSEFAYYPCPEATWGAISQTVPMSGTIRIESTANGHNEFYSRVKEALDGQGYYKLHFYRWFDDPRFYVPLPKGATFLPTTDEVALRTTLAKEGVALTNAQLNWRRMKISELRSIPLFKQEYPESLEDAFLQTRRPWIDPDICARNMERDALEPLKGYLQDSSGRPTEKPIPVEWRVFVHPKPGHRYVISGDCAEGLPDSHFDSADVLDVQTGEQACHIYGRLGPYSFAKQLNDAGRYYHCGGMPAILAVEKAVHGAAVLMALHDKYDYPDSCIYKHEEFDNIARRIKKKRGWVTSNKEKPLMCDALKEAYETGDYVVHDVITHREIRMLQPDENGIPQAPGTGFDDAMMSSAIAWRVKAHKPFKQTGFS